METGSLKNLMDEIVQLKERIAQREQEIEKMRVSNLFFESLFDGIHEEIMVIDENFVVHDANRIFLDHHGLKKEDVMGKKCHEIKYQLDSPCGFGNQSCPLDKAKSTGQRVEVIHNLGKGNFELSESGELMRIMYPVNAHGKAPKYFVEISRDATDYRSMIRKFKGSEKKFRTILDTATDAILSIDENHEIVLFNDAAQRIFGYSRDEVMGKDLNMLIPAQYRDHYRFVKRFLETRSPRVMGRTLSLTALRKGGQEFPIELGLSYHEIENIITFTAIIRDVSSQRKLEKKLLQSERLAAVGGAVAHVAHEIKNPLMIIGGFSHQIKKSLVDEKAAQKLEMILDEVSRLENLVANLGDFTKEYKLMKRPADVNSVIRDVLKIMEEIYSPKKYRFIDELSSGLEEINCDPDKLKQVFMNIIGNGIEAMEEGGAISISTRRISHGIEIQISDEGIGITDKELLHIFEPFYTTREKGSGLGLCISYKIIEAHKGEISADSIPGEGTTFVIRLPAV